MNKIFLICLVLLTFSCESEDQKKQKAQEVVYGFISNIPLDNYEIMYSYYPTFREVESYWKFNSINITSTTLNPDETISIIGIVNDNKQVFFKLEKINGKYLIVSSKGMSSFFESNLYNYCKKIGCIQNDSYDVDVTRICKQNKDEFEQIVTDIKNKIERQTALENHSLDNSYGWISGDLSIKNYSRFTIQPYSYQLYINFYDSNDIIVFTDNQSMRNFESIPFNQSLTIHLFKDNASRYRRVDIKLKIINTTFIEKIIADYAEGTLCRYSGNL